MLTEKIRLSGPELSEPEDYRTHSETKFLPVAPFLILSPELCEARMTDSSVPYSCLLSGSHLPR